MKYFLFSILLITHTTIASPTKIINLRIHPAPNKTQIVFTLSQPIKYHIFPMQNPNRLVIDLRNIKSNTKISNASISSNIIKKIRGNEHKDGTLRVVLDLKQPIQYHSNLLHNKLVIDLWSKTNNKKPQINNKKLRNVIIIIDPGHGGKDPGATGQRGTHEKNVVLAISKDLQKLINKQYGFKAELTRNGDYFISLRQRLNIERRDHADMFIAIHADAYKNHYAQGASVFALSQRGATSEAARWLAQKENESELGHVLANKSSTLRSVLIDLAQTASITTSLTIGDSIVKQLSKVTKLHHDFVEQAAFVVLKEPDVPSLLVETGFISNAQEELKLRNPQYQQKIAHALMFGITEYFKEHPRRLS
jgi:N-acetylmuramoyl-L-alanine amidase